MNPTFQYNLSVQLSRLRGSIWSIKKVIRLPIFASIVTHFYFTINLLIYYIFDTNCHQYVFDTRYPWKKFIQTGPPNTMAANAIGTYFSMSHILLPYDLSSWVLLTVIRELLKITFESESVSHDSSRLPLDGLIDLYEQI